jgi:UDP-glucose 4-epimerase
VEIAKSTELSLFVVTTPAERGILGWVRNIPPGRWVMKALVTGSSGFLGRHICRVLSEEGFDVTGYDLDESQDDIRTVAGDLLDVDQLERAAAGHDIICHIGAIGDVYLAGEQPQLAAAVNVTGSANIATVARKTGARVVNASTWEVYGEPRYQPMDEDHPTDPDHPYNITKLAGERLLLAADQFMDVPVVSLRLGTAYGSGLRPNSVFRIFIDRARRGEPITVQGDGAQGRQFTHASDIARAFVLAARSNVRGVVLNTVASDMVSIKELADLVVDRLPTELSFGDPRPGDVPSALVSASRIADVLGWRAEVPFEQGLEELIESVPVES